VARPKEGYFLPGTRTRIPSVTGIVNRWKDAGPLLHWSNAQGLEGKTLQQARETALTAGSLAHQRIEARLTGQPDVDPDAILVTTWLASEQCLEAFDRWSQAHDLEVLIQEESVVSERYAFGGTFDLVAKVAGRLSLIDFKTSTGGRIYQDSLLQIVAYAMLVEEVHGMKIEEGHILVLGKEDASFTHRSWLLSTLGDARESFLLMRRLYDLDRVLKRKV